MGLLRLLYHNHAGSSRNVLQSRPKRARYLRRRSASVQEREDVLNIGGFSDVVFDLIAEFASGRLSAGHWTEVIERMVIDEIAVADERND